ncbi:hypothetical protein [Streptomyces sp. BE133]|uniref:hypothetical protein n=1 Tax=Streptomyces sp. BE133 TaxID=3002523 RepID=UPI002E78A2DB|nr:hypothetical protein [Streptomyces sp. BE133]MEE1812717.1 hypothetical protein [Streptomyces sp. BE133]
MDAAVRAWLIAQLGTDTDQADLDQRYARLGTARAVALEVVRERLAALRASPGSVSVSGVVSVNFAANIAAYERQIESLEAGEPPAPDDPEDPCGDSADGLGVMYLVERPRR